MARRGKTIPELRWKDTPDFVEVAKGWNNDAITILVKLVWEGYDLMVAEILSEINCNEAEEQLERSITQYLERRIRRRMTGDEPFDVQHEVYEWESRQSAQAQPPQYDIAFYLISNERIIWPLEAKVLKSDKDTKDLGEYIKEINDNFKTCRYAPFSSEGGMLGYLFSGDPNVAFTNIQTKVSSTLSAHPNFPNRDHKTSDHQRVVPLGKSYPAEFRCHHLLLKIIASVNTNTSSA